MLCLTDFAVGDLASFSATKFEAVISVQASADALRPGSQQRSKRPASAERFFLHLLRSGSGRFCCKSLFALLIKNFPGFRRDFRVKMRGTSSPDYKLTDDLRNALEHTRISGRR